MKLSVKAKIVVKSSSEAERWVQVNSGERVGMGLYKELDAMTGTTLEHLCVKLPQIKSFLKRLSPQVKYSDAVVVKDTKLDQLISIYMCFGEWRLGCFESQQAKEAAAVLYDYLVGV